MARQGRQAGQIKVIADANDPHGQARLDAARHVGHHHRGCAQCCGHPHAEADLGRRIALVGMNPTTQHDGIFASHAAKEESPWMARHRGLGKTRELGVVDGAHVGQSRAGRGQARAEHDGHLGTRRAQVLADGLRSHPYTVMKAGR